MNSYLSIFVGVLILVALLVVGILATVRIVWPALIGCIIHWWQTLEWKPREALKSQLFTIANKLGPTPTK